MYLLLMVILAGLGITAVRMGTSRKNRLLKVAGSSLLVLTAIFFGMLNFWGEMLWFDELGYHNRFWKVILSKVGLALLGGVAGWLLIYVLSLQAPRNQLTGFWPGALGVMLGAMIGFNSWKQLLLFINRMPGELTDPILGKKVGFYFFNLPFYEILYQFLFMMGIIALFKGVMASFIRLNDNEVRVTTDDKQRAYLACRWPLTFILLVFAWGQLLHRYQLMTSTYGIVTGPGWTDVNIRMPGYLVTLAFALIGAVMIHLPALWRKLAVALMQRRNRQGDESLAPLLGPPLLVAVIWFSLLMLVPALMQWMRVEPNEITLERDYIEHNIRFTRHGFGMDKIEEREFAATESLSREQIDANQDLMSEIRLWDWRALAQVYEQFQEIRLYYKFPDIDIDRYRFGDQYRQVMVSPREMNLQGLSAESRTFINKRFKYTHGYGITMSTVSEFNKEGLPNLLIKDIPPKSVHADLVVDRPEIYYGELTRTPVVANTEEEEFDYPSGDQNVYNRYQGSGGVPLKNFWRKFVFGWKFDGTRFLLSGYPTSSSRFLFHREILDRAHRIAPFLSYENDPYIVLNKGRLYWIIDAYTTSTRYPYSEMQLMPEGIGIQSITGYRANYIRNAVKVVIDAYNGDVTFYRYDEEDLLIQAWQKVFPGLIKERSEMPEGLRAHVRYPANYLLVQGLVYSKYHMTDPAVFYNQEDLWVRATEKYYQNVQPVDPYYIMWKMPETEDPQFTIMQPFTPKNKQVLIGWIAGLCDGENYGRLITYKFPKERRILGTQQMETKIDQDRFLSGQLSLWDQRGSQVIRGNVLVIPIDDTLLYVEPIYLQANTAAYPELRVVAVMHNDNLSYANTFSEAIEGLFTNGGQRAEKVKSSLGMVDATLKERIGQAQNAFDSYLRLQSERKFDQAAEQLQLLQETLERLNSETPLPDDNDTAQATGEK
jgi:uncharacterized protein